MTLRLRWTEQAVNQLGTIAEYISLASPVYAEQVVERLVDAASPGTEVSRVRSPGP